MKETAPPARPTGGEEQRGIALPGAPGSPLPGAALLALLCAAVFGRTLLHGFVNYDDDLYVYANPVVREGLSLASLKWAFTARILSNWHPVTWISHLADVSIFGLDPAGHHAVNLLLHGANSILLYLLLRRAAGEGGKALFAAALFAVHPLHVESVAWVSERKDLLSTLFLFLASLAWLRHLRAPSAARYLAVALLFALALASKPMPVTFPLLLLLVDAWPLGRHRSVPAAHLVWEKAPLFALSAVSAVATWWSQYHGGSMAPLEDIPLWARGANAALSVGSYLLKTFVPSGLSVLYVHPGTAVPLLPAAAAALALLALTALAWRCRRDRPWLLWGWLFFLVALLPVTGIVQVGMQAMADRYTYVPLVGIFVAVAWEVPALASRLPVAEGTRRRALLAGGAAAVAVLAAVASVRVGDWRDGEALFTSALAEDPANHLAHNNLGNLLHERGDARGAVEHYLEALRIRPDYPDAHYNLAGTLISLGRVDDAISHYRAALRGRGDAETLYNLGNAWAAKGEWGLAAEAYRDALGKDPGHVDARINLGNSVLEMGDIDGAIGWYREALALSPRHPGASGNLLRAVAMKDQKARSGR